ncbi:hypothetical protein D0Z08_30615 [Nocardioides immobilis]|uniref:ABM domain-containing protein n=1 Tax=Nocardioides immobilis TaxID=2049295 RepID=A0A417XSK8_9ACTN|nr:hypothetical protein [Nocardioides immobilis]RHW23295.1 hypothetical protein D0Z08_30615 [Nocardioides immobilis]
MFIQIIQGKCTRQDELHELADEWRRDLAPGAPGWLGGTYGFTDDGMFVGVVRFESRDAAMANSERPEQGEWADRMMELMDGPVEFHDCDDVTMLLDGGSDQAGFVQIIRGKVDDPDRLKAMFADTDTIHEMRPDIIGGTLAIEPDGTFTECVAFTSEDEARAGEQNEPPDEMRRDLEYAMADATFYDLHHPWFASA